MSARQDAPRSVPAVQFPTASEERATAWSLDELELSDLESIRPAWSRTDDPRA